MDYLVKYYVKHMREPEETLVVDRFHSKEEAMERGAWASALDHNPWEGASVWKVNPDFSETRLADYEQGLRA